MHCALVLFVDLHQAEVGEGEIDWVWHIRRTDSLLQCSYASLKVGDLIDRHVDTFTGGPPNRTVFTEIRIDGRLGDTVNTGSTAKLDPAALKAPILQHVAHGLCTAAER